MLAGALALLLSAVCPVTIPSGGQPSPANYGNDSLAVGINPTGTYDAPVFYEANQGHITVKFPWVRKVSGRLQITARRLDRPAPSATSRVPSGYGDIGFQASGVTFPTVGCWEVTGSVGDGTLTFVIELIGEIPVARASIFSTASAVVRWTGNEVATLYDVALRRPGGRWHVVFRTSRTRYVVTRSDGGRVDVRVRGVDKWLVPGPWSRPARVVRSARAR